MFQADIRRCAVLRKRNPVIQAKYCARLRLVLVFFPFSVSFSSERRVLKLSRRLLFL